MNQILYVVDTSVMIKWLNEHDERHLQQADNILTDAEQNLIKLYTPTLAHYEIGNALLKGKQLSVSDAKSCFAVLAKLPILFIHETIDLAEQTYEIGERYGMSYYDATFVALAQSLEASLITDNVRHQGKVSEVSVIPLKTYGAA